MCRFQLIYSERICVKLCIRYTPPTTGIVDATVCTLCKIGNCHKTNSTVKHKSQIDNVWSNTCGEVPKFTRDVLSLFPNVHSTRLQRDAAATADDGQTKHRIRYSNDEHYNAVMLYFFSLLSRKIAFISIIKSYIVRRCDTSIKVR